MRYTINGFFDNTQRHGPVTGRGPGFDTAMEKFSKRQSKLGRVGRWRKAPAKWKQNDGTYIDPEYYIVDWGQDG